LKESVGFGAVVMRFVVRPLDDDDAGLAVNVAPRVVGPITAK